MRTQAEERIARAFGDGETPDLLAQDQGLFYGIGVVIAIVTGCWGWLG